MKWIWAKEEHQNQYVEFAAEFRAEETSEGTKACETYRLRISADTDYAVWINGTFAGNGQYGDYPYYKVYDEIDITRFTVPGSNRIAILGWHMGLDTSMHYSKEAGLAFCILNGEGRTVAESDETTLCRNSRAYRQDISYLITPQLGYAWGYDCTKEDNWKRKDEPGFGAPAVKEIEQELHARPIPKCRVERMADSVIYAQGIYRNPDECRKNTVGAAERILDPAERILNPAERMQAAWLQTKRFGEMTKLAKKKVQDWSSPVPFTAQDGDGIYVVIDLNEESAGYPVIELEVPEECNLYLAYGEQVTDLRVRAEVGGRNFAFEIRLKKGMNRFTGYMRRIAGRYLMLFVESRSMTLHRATLLHCEYPFTVKETHFNDRLLQKIYDAGVRTLRLCAHEHYEDCPWREQALYGMDSRNQMLFGYSVFGEYELPRAGIRLLAYSQKENGLLAICAPTKGTTVIPSFSLYWILALCENAEADYQADFAVEMLPYAERIREAYANRLTGEGIMRFVEQGQWNFHEWVDGLDGDDVFEKGENKRGVPWNAAGQEANGEATKDLISTALFYLAMKKLAWLEGTQGKEAEAARCEELAKKAKEAAKAYYCPENGLYATFRKNGEKVGIHGYTLSLLVCAGIVPEEHKKVLAQALKNPKEVSFDNRGILTDGLIEQSYATLQWKYDALLESGVSSVEEIVEEICETFGRVVLDGLTTLPETEFREDDFGEGGSLCHAWSAVPCYIFNRYLGGEEK